MCLCVELVFFFVCFRCELCSLTEEELEQNEELRKEISNLERVADNLYDVGMYGQGLEKLEQKVELMERHWEEFCLEVKSSKIISRILKIFGFPVSKGVLPL